MPQFHASTRSRRIALAAWLGACLPVSFPAPAEAPAPAAAPSLLPGTEGLHDLDLLATDGAGHLFILDRRVLRYTLGDHKLEPVATGGLDAVTGLAADASGNCYLSGPVGKEAWAVVRISPGNLAAPATISTSREEIQALTADAAGDLYYWSNGGGAGGPHAPRLLRLAPGASGYAREEVFQEEDPALQGGFTCLGMAVDPGDGAIYVNGVPAKGTSDSILFKLEHKGAGYVRTGARTFPESGFGAMAADGAGHLVAAAFHPDLSSQVNLVPVRDWPRNGGGGSVLALAGIEATIMGLAADRRGHAFFNQTFERPGVYQVDLPSAPGLSGDSGPGPGR